MTGDQSVNQLACQSQVHTQYTLSVSQSRRGGGGGGGGGGSGGGVSGDGEPRSGRKRR